jgi:amidase
MTTPTGCVSGASSDSPPGRTHSTDHDHIGDEQDGPVVATTFGRRDRTSATGRQMHEELVDAWDRFPVDESAAVAALTGRGSEAIGREQSVEDKAMWRWGATQIVSNLRAGVVTATEVLESCLERIDETNRRLNALVEIDEGAARDAAALADRRLREGEYVGPLHGVPVATKINTNQAGVATSDGVVAFKDAVMERDSPVIANLRRAGAVLTGRSNSPAFAYRWFSDNDLFGRTDNPWSPNHTPGGSSGGASAAVASGMVPIAQGNDIGGSIRYPAYACGLVGLRPTVGRIPMAIGPPDQDAPLSVQSMAVQGPLARSVADIRLAVGAMEGFSPEDPSSVPVLKVERRQAQEPFRVGIVTDSSIAAPARPVVDALETAAHALETAGHELVDVELPMVEEAYRLWYLLCMEEFRQLMPLVEEVGGEGMQLAAATYYTAAKEWWGDSPDRDTYMNGYARRGTLIAELQKLLVEFPVVLMPVSAELAFEHDADISSLERGLEVVQAQWSMMGIPLLGFPAASVPTGIQGGLPVGVQLLGQRFEESSILDIAEIIEAHCGGFTPIDPVAAE